MGSLNVRKYSWKWNHIPSDRNRKYRNINAKKYTGYPDNFKFESADQIKEYLSHDKITCLLCGKDYTTLAVHLSFIHRIPVRDYKIKFGIPIKYGLCTKEFSNKHSLRMKKRSETEEFKENVKKLSKYFKVNPVDKNKYIPPCTSVDKKNRKLNKKEIQEISTTPEEKYNRHELAKKFNCCVDLITKYRKKCTKNIERKKSFDKLHFLKEDEIIFIKNNKDLSQKELCEKFGIKRLDTISDIKNGRIHKNIGKASHLPYGKNTPRLTADQIDEIKNDTTSHYSVLCNKFNVHKSTIFKIRRNNVNYVNKYKDKDIKSMKFKRKFSDQEINKIRNSELSGRELSKIYGCSASLISSIINNKIYNY
jgi:predicted transcriptional regulator